ncbi:MAG: NUDIX domain-containing protein [Dysgonomonas sp.]
MDQPSLKSQLPEDKYLPGLSVDCVIIGFHNGTLKILLNKFNTNNKWMLPGGFVLKDENIDDAAYRHLKNRTGLKEVFLKQFHTFGDSDRTDIEENKSVLQKKERSERKSRMVFKQVCNDCLLCTGRIFDCLCFF